MTQQSKTPQQSELFSGSAAGMRSVPPLLDDIETTVQPNSTSTYREFLISGIRTKMAIAESLYESIDSATQKKRAVSLRGCRTIAWFVRHKESGQIRVAANSCHLRWCPLCAKTRRYFLQSSVGKWIRGLNRPKFLTLTLRSQEAPLAVQIDYMYKFFRQFRLTKFAKKHFHGGIWFFQVTKNEKTGLWHPHLHIAIDGKYVDIKQISKQWERITHGSSIVDIKEVKDPKKCAEYVSRYASQPCSLESLDANSRVDLFNAFSGRRIVGTWGSAKGVDVAGKKCTDKESWEKISPYWSTILLARKSYYHQEILRAWKAGDVCSSVPIEENRGFAPPDCIIDEPITYKQHCIEFSGVLSIGGVH